MKQENLISAVNAIHADPRLKEKVLSGRTSGYDKKPVGFTFFKCAACLMALLIVGLSVLTVPRILKPAGTTAPASQTAPVSSGLGQPGYVNGLYRDDAVTNILLLGIDNYQKDDIGRSDSIILVSVDTRHKKLKVTSFLRDLYIPVPGMGSIKLNSAYSLAGGGANGAEKTASAIETNFGIDIDRYAVVEYSAFSQIIDTLGGVSVTLNAAEAKLVNQYSGDPRRNLAAGTFTLSGAQARYYSRIRSVSDGTESDDFARTGRQRRILSAIAEKLGAEDIGTISSALAKVLPFVTTDMTKNEAIALAGSSFAVLHYPVSQSRVPANDAYHAMAPQGNGAYVLVPELAENRQLLIKFIYEKDIALS